MKPRAPIYLVRTAAAVLLAALLGSAAAFAQAPSVPGVPASMATPGATTVSTTDDIRDIRGPQPIASPWLWMIWTGAGVLLISGAYVGWRWQRRRAPTPVSLPHETALVRLEAARALMRPESVRLFSITVSDIVRLYIEQRFQVRAAHRTSEEFLYDLLEPSDDLLAAHRRFLAGFLNYCDLAKFGGWMLSAQEMESMHQSARTFVLATSAAPHISTVTRKTTPSSPDKDIYDSVSSA